MFTLDFLDIIRGSYTIDGAIASLLFFLLSCCVSLTRHGMVNSMEQLSTDIFDAKIAELTAEIARYKAIRDGLADPQFVEELRAVLNTRPARIVSATGTFRPRPAAQPAKTNYQRIVEHFKSTGNKPIAPPDLVKATGISRGNLSNSLYKAQADHYEFLNHPTHARMRLVRLKPQYLQDS